MPTPAEQPRFDQPVVDQRGLVTRAWQDYFLRMSSRSSQEDLAAIVAEIQRRVDELANGQALNFRIFGQSSIVVNGVVQPDGVVIITLEGDEDAPGNTAYYGTGPTGQKGWFTVESAIEVAADELTKAVAGTGVVTLGLADLADSGVGAALVKIPRDAKGRVSGTEAATTDDLPQGAVNKYFPEAPIDGYPYARGSSAWLPLDGPFSPYYLLKFPVLTDQAGNVLTDQHGQQPGHPVQLDHWNSGQPGRRSRTDRLGLSLPRLGRRVVAGHSGQPDDPAVDDACRGERADRRR